MKLKIEHTVMLSFNICVVCSSVHFQHLFFDWVWQVYFPKCWTSPLIFKVCKSWLVILTHCICPPVLTDFKKKNKNFTESICYGTVQSIHLFHFPPVYSSHLQFRNNSVSANVNDTLLRWPVRQVWLKFSRLHMKGFCETRSKAIIFYSRVLHT